MLLVERMAAFPGLVDKSKTSAAQQARRKYANSDVCFSILKYLVCATFSQPVVLNEIIFLLASCQVIS